jgi:hypothetical protein
MKGSPPSKLIPSGRNHGAFLMLFSLLIGVLFGAHMIDIIRHGGVVDGMFVALYAICTLGTFGAGFQFFDGLYFMREDVLALMDDKVDDPVKEQSEATA